MRTYYSFLYWHLASTFLLVVAYHGTTLAIDNDSNVLSNVERIPFTTSRIVGSPDPPPPYITTVAFPHLKFDEPLDLIPIHGTNRLAAVQMQGKIFSFSNERNEKEPELILDVDNIAFGAVFHPRFTENGFVYVTYITEKDPTKMAPLGTRLSRFRITQQEPPRADPDSEQIILQWPSGGHNGGCLKFGPDGYLYVATGDSGMIADTHLNGQNLATLSGAILRIDVDHIVDSQAYRIPAENPFVNKAEARPEIWAYGLRQPWKMSFDRETGELWTGNVGQDLWEQVYRIERGGNYGWSVMEGSHPFRPERKRGPSPILMPIVEHNHTELRSVTGGFFYYGDRLPELRGAYLYGDYDTGEVWMLRFDREEQRVTEHRQLTDSTLRLVGFAQDASGEVYLLDHVRGRIFELTRNPKLADDSENEFPRRLSKTGLYSSVPNHEVAPGVIPYKVTAPQWMDGAFKERFLAMPGMSQIEFDGITYPQPAEGAPHGWKFPHGTIIFETISLGLKPEQPRRLETRVLHHEQLEGGEAVGDQIWRAYTYIWNDEQTDAVLLEDPHGRDQTFTVHDPTAPDEKRQQTWHFPSRAECTVCHNMAAKYVVGINTMQMNREHSYAGGPQNQLAAFEQLNLFTTPLPDQPQHLPHLVDYQNDKLDVEPRARSYLHANCSHCHRKWGGGNAEFNLLGSLTLDEMGIANTHPGRGSFYIPGASLLSPGDPSSSLMIYRMSTTGPGRMPRLGSRMIDVHGLQLIYDWIASMPSDQPASSVVTAALAQHDTTADFSTTIHHLLQSTASALQLVQAIDRQELSQHATREIVALGSRHAQAHIRDLFERYLPEGQRTQRLGVAVGPEQILILEGDPQRGKEVFTSTAGVQCKNCHKIGDVGKTLGPELTHIGKKYDRAKILENILDPSREIDPKYQVQLVELNNGRILTGIVVKRDGQQLWLRDAQNKEIQLNTANIESLTAQQQSLMPDLLLRDMTAQQVADLIAYLINP